MEGHLEPVQLVGAQEVNGVKPFLDGAQAVFDDVKRKMLGGGVLQVGDQPPHRGGGSLKLCRKCRVVSVGFKLNVVSHLSSVDVHSLEHGEVFEPHDELLLVLHELVGNGGMGEHVVEVGDQRPVAVFLHHVLAAVHDLMVVLLDVPEGVEG